ncbi:hypothetical protein HHK36_011301 [Tetracentron sinense]|uniref:Uncharacterized protein n=1 Tax=Tetracentron sinense TaxID=13715 RepID=A0A835DJR9_TETSI|nr:hypothetical protein HHK36_011301 [Tetracentron sinense]
MKREEIRMNDRARKRRKKDVCNVGVDRWEGLESEGRVVGTRSKAFVGRYVRKEFDGNVVFLGKVVSNTSGLYRVNYENGDCEDLECGEVLELLMQEGDFNEELNIRKKKLDELIEMSDLKMQSRSSGRKVVASANGLDSVETSSVSKLSSGRKALDPDGVRLFEEADSSSDSCEYVRVGDSCSETEIPLIPPPSLPPSSGSICIPEEYASHLFSVYNFLRSFSIRLFLSPFGLDDFVGSLNCVVPNTLLDAIHVALMRALKRHLEMLLSDGSEIASKCLRCIDWSLLDTLTWPVYLVQYLLVMGYKKGPEWKEFYSGILDREYYTLSAAKKLMVLQILCDDVIESAELRAEINMREDLEVVTDSDGTANVALENGPKRVHPRYSKTSACKDPEAMAIIAECHESQSPCHPSSLGSKITEIDANAADVDQDGNGDECRLCGMDGTLLCCDGCPHVYHSRCIGLSKVLIPEGSWFCPECTVNMARPTLRMGTALAGAEIFGIDLYEQVFLGTCNHLLVLKGSINAEPLFRYYNRNDIPKVLRVLYSSQQHTTLYSGICKAILQYWEIPEDKVLYLPGKNEIGTKLVATLSNTFSGQEIHKALDRIKGEKCASRDIEALSCYKNDFKEALFDDTSLNTVTQTDFPGLHRNNDATIQHVCSLTNTKFHEQVGTESTISIGSSSLQADPSDLTHQSLADRSSVIDFATCTSGISHGNNRGHANGMFLPAKNGLLSCENKEGKHGDGGRSEGAFADDCSYMGSFFKPQAYINQYILGDVAASAAANLAVLTSVENRVSKAPSSLNPRKVLSANISLQIKAFSSASVRFFWPNSEKKLLEVPRERCGWCLSCKSPATSKKGCLLNLVASNAMKGAARILGGPRLIMNGEGNFHCIANYILYMEERLRGLVVGPFQTASYRKQWQKQVEQASTCSATKLLLLESLPFTAVEFQTTDCLGFLFLELFVENIRLIALSGGWVKMVDEGSVESSFVQSATCSVGSTQKHGPGGRRNRKQSASQIATNPCHGNLSYINWWRGRKVSKLVFQKRMLPCSMVKKAARQGGSRKISGIYYTEGSEIPKRSRRFAWRAAVEMSKNASQLALQVRYLDLHVKWSDFVRPEQHSLDGKGSEAEASAFRNALICDKKIQENKIRYGLAFGNQKHLPSRVMKNIISVEQNQDGKDKFWFSESHIPLYLIKEYEENSEKVPFLSTKKASFMLSKLQRRQLKASRRDIFLYLMHKGEKLEKCSCASCQQDVLLRDAAKCSACQGYCHKDCTIPFHTKEEPEFVITCNQCYHENEKARTLYENSKKSPTSQLSFQGQEYQNAVTDNKCARQTGYHLPLVSLGTMKSHSAKKPLTTGPNRQQVRRVPASYGLKWKKKNSVETGANFRLSNILLRGNADMEPSMQPNCCLCLKPYNSGLMYICCEACKQWYHADAIQLEESKIFDVVGFMCCKCHRQRSPVCPFMDLECRKQRMKTLNQGSAAIREQPKRCDTPMPESHTKMEEVIIEDDDPLLFSLEKVEQIMELPSEVDLELYTARLQKLPVSRFVNCEMDMNDSSVNLSHVESTPLEASNILNTAEKAFSPQVEWDLPIKNETVNCEGVNYEDMEFEPQTFFSFSDLLVSEDDQLDIFCRESSGFDTILQSHPPEGNEMITAKDHKELAAAVEPAANTVICQICSHTEPAPDLSCEICGIWIHNHCSPWVEPSSWEERWRCGLCREWR